MSLYFRWGGVALLLIAALYINRGYKNYLTRRLDEYRGLSALMLHMEGMISKFLSFGDGLWRDFSDEALEKCGLLPALRGGESLQGAFDKCRDKMSLSKASKDKLCEKFHRLGKGYKNAELRVIGEIRADLNDEIAFETAEAQKNMKVTAALLFGGALAAVIMML